MNGKKVTLSPGYPSSPGSPAMPCSPYRAQFHTKTFKHCKHGKIIRNQMLVIKE